MRTEQITCDGCGDDNVAFTGNCNDWYLQLANVSCDHRGNGAVTMMNLSPPIDRTAHFCSLKCLDLWRSRDLLRTKLWKEWHDEWREAHKPTAPSGYAGTSMKPFYSYTEAPDDVRAATSARIEVAVMAAFPLKEQTHANR